MATAWLLSIVQVSVEVLTLRMNVAFAEVTASLKALAIAQAAPLMPAAFVTGTAVHVPERELPSAHAATSQVALPRHGHMF
jgi:hypothetical protein